MKKLMINTSLVRKEPAFEVRPCVVEKAIGISHKEFEHLRTHALEDNDIIAKNKGNMSSSTAQTRWPYSLMPSTTMSRW